MDPVDPDPQFYYAKNFNILANLAAEYNRLLELSFGHFHVQILILKYYEFNGSYYRL